MWLPLGGVSSPLLLVEFMDLNNVISYLDLNIHNFLQSDYLLGALQNMPANPVYSIKIIKVYKNKQRLYHSQL